MAEFGDVYQKIATTKEEVELVVDSAGVVAELLDELGSAAGALGFHARSAACHAAAELAREGMVAAGAILEKLDGVHTATYNAQEQA
ncbi:hypothetical protein Lfu02_57900 [Longispora fulva]|uniref:Uncharacterized protein n=1 Tax=Longispora fulva TaxID=619741 RepID=A0A8J7GEH3_9ACTN|nr:hypothetical protein [Longispora fulva]MBG6137229.1 hypothetical protein [Longispora fulva]GIG61418.1 hypothetical protein Lfu02_57900 [Longispora fulva]